MTIARSILPLLALAALALAGCITPEKRWAIAREALTATQDTTVALNKAGVLSDGDYLKAHEFELVARNAIAEARRRLDTEQADEFDYWLGIAEAALDKLAEVKAGASEKALRKDVTGLRLEAERRFLAAA